MIDRRPALIARCASARDVSEAVNLAREQNLVVAVRPTNLFRMNQNIEPLTSAE